MKYTVKRALVTSHQSLIQHPLKSEERLPLTSVEIGSGPQHSCPNSVYFVPNMLILEQSFWQQKPLSQTWPATLPAPHHKLWGGAAESRRTGGEGLFAEQGEGAGKTERRERSHRGMITEEDVGLGCKLEVGKLGQALRKAGRELLASSAAESEGIFHGEVWSGWKKAGRSYWDRCQKRQSKEDKVQRKQETSAAVGTIISGNIERICLVKAGLQQFNIAVLRTACSVRHKNSDGPQDSTDGRKVLMRGWTA